MAQITPEGLKKLKEELDYLENVKRKEIAARLERAIGFGDLSENADYQEATQEYRKLENRIRELRQRLAKVKVVTHLKTYGLVGPGSKVILESEGKIFNYQIVSPEEADPSKGLISFDSPLGKALVGKKKGEKFTLELPLGSKLFIIKDVL